MFKCQEIIICVDIVALSWRSSMEKHSWYYKEINEVGDYPSFYGNNEHLSGYPLKDDTIITGITIGNKYEVLSNYGEYLLIKNDDGVLTKYRVERFKSKIQLRKIKLNQLKYDNI